MSSPYKRSASFFPRDSAQSASFVLYVCALACCGCIIPLGTSPPPIFAHARHLQDVSTLDTSDATEVRTAEELKAAILAGTSRIHFVEAVVLSETLYPGMHPIYRCSLYQQTHTFVLWLVHRVAAASWCTVVEPALKPQRLFASVGSSVYVVTGFALLNGHANCIRRTPSNTSVKSGAEGLLVVRLA